MIYNRLIVAAIGFIRLEPYDGKLSRTVLRGGKDSNALLLPDFADKSTSENAAIYYGRHLQNLDHESGVAEDIKKAKLGNSIHFEKQEEKETDDTTS